MGRLFLISANLWALEIIPIAAQGPTGPTGTGGPTGPAGAGGSTGAVGPTGPAGPSAFSPVNLQTNIDYTLALTDAGGLVRMNSAADHMLTVPQNATVAFPIGTVIWVQVANANPGNVLIAPDTSVAFTAASGTVMSMPYQMAMLTKLGANTWEVLIIPKNTASGVITDLTIAATTTYTTAGVSMGASAAGSQAWRIRVYGSLVAVNSPTARTARIALFWGTTQLTAFSDSIIGSVGQTTTWEAEFEIIGRNTTLLTVTGKVLHGWNTGSSQTLSIVAAANTTVTAGLQQLDLRFSMSVVVAGDIWHVNQVTMEQLY
jgi:hypothetical protein